MQVVATAGHVDHGKSTLVRALTGMDPDRLEEERRRGLSIELGHCWMTLSGVGDVAFVDVPGHQKFIATTIAGLGPAPVAMLVVAADDPWMPQTAEHLAALDALGVQHGVLVVTRSDLADPAQAMATARMHLQATSLRAAPAVAVSGLTGAGVAELRAVLSKVLTEVPTPDPDADIRLWVDRRFHIRGVGAVATGTLTAGTIELGDRLSAGETEVRVRGLETLGTSHQRVTGVSRVAIHLGGRVETVRRGTALLSTDAFVLTDLADARILGDGVVPREPILHIGTTHVGVRARALGGGMYRLSLERRLPLRAGDRAILRDPGSRILWAAEVLDPVPPPLGRRGAAAARALDLIAHDRTSVSELRLRGVTRRSLLRRAGVPTQHLPEGTVESGDWLVDPDFAGVLRSRLAALVAATHAAGAELTTASAAHELGLSDPAIVTALLGPPLATESGRILDTRNSDLQPGVQASLDVLTTELDGSPFAAPTVARLNELGLDPRTLAVLHRAHQVLRLSEGVVLLPESADQAVVVLSDLDQPFTAGAARAALGTSRRVALALLAHLDEVGRTIRLVDDRRRIRAGLNDASS